jgi:hypothetical protein
MRLGRKFYSNDPTISKTKVKMYGCEILRLQEKYGRRLKKKDVVAEAKDRRSPIHGYFEWHNGKAAEKYRLEQAGNLLRIVHVDVVDEKGRSVPARAVHSVFVAEEGKAVRAFVRHDDVLNKPYYRIQRIEQALNELEQWCRRHQLLKELAPLRDLIIQELEQHRLGVAKAQAQVKKATSKKLVKKA